MDRLASLLCQPWEGLAWDVAGAPAAKLEQLHHLSDFHPSRLSTVSWSFEPGRANALVNLWRVFGS